MSLIKFEEPYMSEKKEKPYEPLSDGDLLAMYAAEVGQSLKKEDSTCPGCTDKKTCTCVREAHRAKKGKPGKNRW